jgi:heterodisulfide reductase subunit C
MGLELLPRQLFLYSVAGLKEKIVDNRETIFSCLLCRLCEQNCPRGVHIAEDVRYLRNYINRRVYKIARN